VHYGEQIMKFFAAFFVTGTLLLGASSVMVTTKTQAQTLVPSKIVDSKKLEPLKVPHNSCIVSGVEVSDIALEEYMKLCLSQRNWLNITFDERVFSIKNR
jgi:hypothetical protein